MTSLRLTPWLAPLVLVACASPAAPPPATAAAPCTAASTSSSAAPVSSASAAAPDSDRPATPEEALTRFWSSRPVSDSWFSPAFLAHVPIATVTQIRGQLGAEVGALTRIEKTDDGYRCVFEKATLPSKAKLDGEGRFTTLWFGPPEMPIASVDAAVAALRALPGHTSLIVLEDGKERASVDADDPLAVGSTFKLAVLAALRGQIDAKKRSWKDVVPLDPKYKSLPSGALHEWPDATALTLQSLATSMISVSDNTAADALLSIAGRDQVEKLAPKVTPFLSTREAFVLKAPANADLLAKWRAADDKGKRAMLADVDARPLPGADAFEGDTPRALDVEWHISVRDLCALMGKVHDLPLMSVNPGLAKAKEWDRVAYKGGSEPGVLNTTTWLAAGSKSFCVSATWNDDAKSLEEGRFFGIYGGLLHALHP